MLDVNHVNKYVSMSTVAYGQEIKGPSPKVERKYRLEP